jgi:hypothetical protein
MSTTPPEQPGTGTGGTRTGGGYGMPSITSGARMPIPGNAEFLYVIVALILVAIIALIADTIDAPSWLDYFKWVSVAYILSRGIAKASRVLEQ